MKGMKEEWNPSEKLVKSIDYITKETKNLFNIKIDENTYFEDEFVKHARLDAKLNDQRFLVKNEINNFYDSNIIECRYNSRD